MIRGPKKSVNVLLPLELYDRLKLSAEESQRPMSAHVRHILRRYVRYADEHKDDSEDKWAVR